MRRTTIRIIAGNRIHPAANIFPMMTSDELSALALDIKEHGGPHLTKPPLARAVRTAIQWVLTAEGIIEMRKRRISPAIKREKRHEFRTGHGVTS